MNPGFCILRPAVILRMYTERCPQTTPCDIGPRTTAMRWRRDDKRSLPAQRRGSSRRPSSRLLGCSVSVCSAQRIRVGVHLYYAFPGPRLQTKRHHLTHRHEVSRLVWGTKACFFAEQSFLYRTTNLVLSHFVPQRKMFLSLKQAEKHGDESNSAFWLEAVVDLSFTWTTTTSWGGCAWTLRELSCQWVCYQL